MSEPDEADAIPRGRITALDQMRAASDNADRLLEIVEASKSLSPQISADNAVRELAVTIGLPFLILRQIFGAIDNLTALKVEFGSASKAVDTVVKILEDKAPSDLQKKRKKIEAAIDAYSDDNPIAISLKAQRLALQHEKLFLNAEIITDARPVFDSKANSVLEYVITHSLLITYHEDTGDDMTPHNHRRLHIAMDEKDVLKLRKASDRALQKSAALKSELKPKGRVLGDDNREN